MLKHLSSLSKHYDFSLNEKWQKLPKKLKILFYMVQMKRKLNFLTHDGYEKYSHKKTFEGVINNLERRYLKPIVIGKEKK